MNWIPLANGQPGADLNAPNGAFSAKVRNSNGYWTWTVITGCVQSWDYGRYLSEDAAKRRAEEDILSAARGYARTSREYAQRAESAQTGISALAAASTAQEAPP